MAGTWKCLSPPSSRTGEHESIRVYFDKTGGNGFKLKEGKIRLDIKEVFYNRDVDALKQVAQRGGGCPVLEDIQGQAGPCSEQPDLAVTVSVHCRGVGLDDL